MYEIKFSVDPCFRARISSSRSAAHESRTNTSQNFRSNSCQSEKSRPVNQSLAGPVKCIRTYCNTYSNGHRFKVVIPFISSNQSSAFSGDSSPVNVVIARLKSGTTLYSGRIVGVVTSTGATISLDTFATLIVTRNASYHRLYKNHVEGGTSDHSLSPRLARLTRLTSRRYSSASSPS